MRDALTRNRSIYERTVKLIQRGWDKRPLENTVALIEGLAHFATHAHTGLFRDDRLENWLAELGQPIEPIGVGVLKERYPKALSNGDQPLLLHVATTIYTVGGHVNYLERMAEWDDSHRHLLVVTRQEGHAYKSETIELFERSGGGVIFLEGSFANRVSILKSLVEIVDQVLLHQHQYDPTGVMAFGGLNREVGMVNHSDHTFWLGASVIHHTLEFRKESLWVSRELREIPETRFVPLPVKEPKPVDSPNEVRQALDIPEDAIVFISMGSAHKFRPWKDRNFFQWMDEILENISKSYLVVVGIDPASYTLESTAHEKRIRLIAPTPEPGPYLAASDYVVDPIPHGSFTAVLEGCAFGCIPILPICSHSLLNLSQDPAISGCHIQAKEPLEVVQQIARYHNEGRQTSLKTLAQQMEKHHFRRGWILQFQEEHKLSLQPIGVDHSTIAELHDDAFPKAVKKLAQVISDSIGGRLDAFGMRFLQQLWMYSGLSFGQSSKWVLSRKLKKA